LSVGDDEAEGSASFGVNMAGVGHRPLKFGEAGSEVWRSGKPADRILKNHVRQDRLAAAYDMRLVVIEVPATLDEQGGRQAAPSLNAPT
jgi:hypothetical protein